MVYFPASHLSHAQQYSWSITIRCLGTLISRSSHKLFLLPSTWLYSLFAVSLGYNWPPNAHHFTLEIDVTRSREIFLRFPSHGMWQICSTDIINDTPLSYIIHHRKQGYISTFVDDFSWFFKGQVFLLTWGRRFAAGNHGNGGNGGPLPLPPVGIHHLRPPPAARARWGCCLQGHCIHLTQKGNRTIIFFFHAVWCWCTACRAVGPR